MIEEELNANNQSCENERKDLCNEMIILTAVAMTISLIVVFPHVMITLVMTIILASITAAIAREIYNNYYLKETEQNTLFKFSEKQTVALNINHNNNKQRYNLISTPCFQIKTPAQNNKS